MFNSNSLCSPFLNGKFIVIVFSVFFFSPFSSNVKIIQELLVSSTSTFYPSDFAEVGINGEIPKCFPHKNFLDEDASHCKPAEGYFSCSAVVSSLPLTVSWLRAYAMDNPRLRLQVFKAF